MPDGFLRPTNPREVLRSAGTLLRRGEVERAFGLVGEASAAARAGLDPTLPFEVVRTEASMLLWLGRTEEVVARGSAVLAADPPPAWSRSETWDDLLGVVVEALLEEGEVERAGLVLELDRSRRGVGRSPCLRQAAERFDLVVGRPSAPASGTRRPIGQRLRLVDLEKALWTGALEPAVAMVERAVRERAIPEDPVETSWFANLGMRACADLRERATEHGDGDGVRLARRTAALLDRLVDDRNLAEVTLASRRATTAAEGADWFAERARTHGYPDASRWWRTAAERWQAHGRPHREAYARWRLAQALHASGDGRQGDSELRTAVRLAASHLPLTSATRATAAAWGLDIGPEPGQPASDASALLPTLTPRERTVMELIGSGLTTGAVARRLRISPRTVAKHLENVYAKLGCDNRVSALVRLRGGAGADGR